MQTQESTLSIVYFKVPIQRGFYACLKFFKKNRSMNVSQYALVSRSPEQAGGGGHCITQANTKRGHRLFVCFIVSFHSKPFVNDCKYPLFSLESIHIHCEKRCSQVYPKYGMNRRRYSHRQENVNLDKSRVGIRI